MFVNNTGALTTNSARGSINERRPSFALQLLKSVGQRLSISSILGGGSDPVPQPLIAANGDQWMDDTETTVCTLCDDPFTLLSRRHHCRQCGRLVCGVCSTHRATFSVDGVTAPHRVCDRCHQSLSLILTDKEYQEEKTQLHSQSHSSYKEVRFGDTETIPVLSINDVSEQPIAIEQSINTEQDIYFYPSPINSVQPILSIDLFDRMAGFGSLMCIDLRSLAAYEDGHLPRSISLPLSLADCESAVPLSVLESRVSLLDKRVVRMRQRANIVLIVNDTINDTDRAVLHYISQLLLDEGKLASLSILCPGYQHFSAHYPFLDCVIADTSSKIHQHLPAFPGYATEILPSFLYLGSHVDAENRSHLLALNVRHIVNVTCEVANHHEHDSDTAFHYHSFPIEDLPSTELFPIFESLFHLLDQYRSEGERVLIHCHQGVSRSTSVVLAYLIHSRRWTLKSAYDYVKNKRKQIMPNVGFWRQLSKYEQTFIDSDSAVDRKLMIVNVNGLEARAVDDGFRGSLDQCVDMAALQQEYDEMIATRERRASQAFTTTGDDSSEGGDENADNDSEDPDSTVINPAIDEGDEQQENSVVIMASSAEHSVVEADDDDDNVDEGENESEDDVIVLPQS